MSADKWFSCPSQISNPESRSIRGKWLNTKTTLYYRLLTIPFLGAERSRSEAAGCPGGWKSFLEDGGGKALFDKNIWIYQPTIFNVKQRFKLVVSDIPIILGVIDSTKIPWSQKNTLATIKVSYGTFYQCCISTLVSMRIRIRIQGFDDQSL
jgi:hypothetical protein